MPNKFQGNPVKKKLLIHSDNTIIAEKTRYCEIGNLRYLVSQAGIAVNKPKNKPDAKNAIGINQPKVFVSISRALFIHDKPNAKNENPK